MNGITFNRQNGGLGRRLPGEDHISGLIVLDPNGDELQPFVLNGVDDLLTNGIHSDQNTVIWYHASEYFRLNPGSQLYVMQTSSFNEYEEIVQLQNFAQGKIRQVAILDYSNELIDYVAYAINNSVKAGKLSENNMPLIVLYQYLAESINLADLQDWSLANENVRLSILIGQDQGGFAKYFFAENSIRLGMGGAVLGAVSRAKVNESIAWVERQNLVTTAYSKTLTGGDVQYAKELDVAGFTDGSLYSDLTAGQLQSLHDKGYIFMVKHVGFAGTYLNDSFTATARNSDFAYIENNRTMDKAQRGVYGALLPKISGPLLIDATSGFIREDVVAGLEALAAFGRGWWQRAQFCLVPTSCTR